MKPIYLFMIAVMATTSLCAQTSATARKSFSFSGAIEQVLYDFPHNLHAVSGELIIAEGGVENYESLVTLPGSEECKVSRYHSMEDTTASWQAKMFHDEDFKKASTQYKDLYRQLKGCHLKLVDGSLIFLNGEWDAPKEEKDITMSTLRLVTGDARYKEVKIDLEMTYQFPEWVIQINIVSKKKDSLEGYADAEGL